MNESAPFAIPLLIVFFVLDTFWGFGLFFRPFGLVHPYTPPGIGERVLYKKTLASGYLRWWFGLPFRFNNALQVLITDRRVVLKTFSNNYCFLDIPWHRMRGIEERGGRFFALGRLMVFRFQEADGDEGECGFYVREADLPFLTNAFAELKNIVPILGRTFPGPSP